MYVSCLAEEWISFKNKQVKGSEIVADCILSLKLDYMWYIYVYHSNYEYAVYMY